MRRPLTWIATIGISNGFASLTMKTNATTDQLAAALERTQSHPTASLSVGDITFTNLPVRQDPNPNDTRKMASLVTVINKDYHFAGTVSGTEHPEYKLTCTASDSICHKEIIAIQDVFDTYAAGWGSLDVHGSDYSIRRDHSDGTTVMKLIQVLPADDSVRDLHLTSRNDSTSLTITTYTQRQADALNTTLGRFPSITAKVDVAS